MTAPSLIFAWGNPSRGDDALGPLFIEELRERLQHGNAWRGVECLTDFQLQVEHALDLQDREQVLFVDASVNCSPPFEVSPLTPYRDLSFTSHAMTPQAVLQVYVELNCGEPPPSLLLAIRGERFELGAGLGGAARSHLQAALGWATDWLVAATG